ncbi:hypothetical protein [Chryseobacterium sp.]|uniref:hypothetical protein n=1 Tax=Chryseobacterium sp. TaxID=1871047 RepID=UPI0011CCD6CD|nr:hypothetical protein [Chryseobacterium sp.]TXF74868.1 hypothetical protein FUA25_11295 [Chryseobacterium sp.]
MRTFLFIFMHISIFCFSQENKCARIIDSINAPLFEKKPALSQKIKKLAIKNEDSLNWYYYKGLVNQFSRENYLIVRSSGSSKYTVPLQRCISYVLLDWQTADYYTKKGVLAKRKQTFFDRISSERYLIFNKYKAVPSVGLGDALFKMNLEGFIKILEENNITPQTTKMRTGRNGGKLFISKHITPSGSFWEYELMFTGDPFISVLVADSTKKAIVTTYDFELKNVNDEMVNEYYKIKDSILYPKNDGFILNENQIIEILTKNRINETAINIKKYAGRTWLVQTNIDPNGVKKSQPVLLLIDDKNGNILIDINKYPPDIFGEQQFINDFNTILRNRTE